LLHLGEQRFHRVRIAYVGRQHQGVAAPCIGRRLFEQLLAPSDQADAIPVFEQRQCGILTDAGTGAGDDGNLVV